MLPVVSPHNIAFCVSPTTKNIAFSGKARLIDRWIRQKTGCDISAPGG